jgi:transmembrane sensor
MIDKKTAADIDATPPNDQLHAAAEWWVRLRDAQRNEPMHAHWLEWSTQNPRHIDSFERISELADQLGALGAQEKTVFIAEFAPRQAPRTPWLRWAMAAGFVAVALTGGSLAWLRMNSERVESANYSTAIAVDRDIALPDGSRVALGGASELRTRFAQDMRQVELDKGEAFFQVAHDTSRPFIVAAGEVSIRAVGTAFNVRRTGERVTIAVTEGRVRIASSDGAAMAKTSGADALEAVAGQQISYDPRASGLAVVSISPAQATLWRDHRLEFLNEPLDIVVANINRYSLRPLMLADAKLGNLTFTGTVKPEALDGWLRALPKILPVQIQASTDRITIAAIDRKPH